MRTATRSGDPAPSRRTRAATHPRRGSRRAAPTSPELRRALAALRTWSQAPVRTDPILFEPLPNLPAITRRLLERLEQAQRIEQAMRLPWFAIPLA